MTEQLPQNEDRLTPKTLRANADTLHGGPWEQAIRRTMHQFADAWEAEQKQAKADRTRLEAARELASTMNPSKLQLLSNKAHDRRILDAEDAIELIDCIVDVQKALEG